MRLRYLAFLSVALLALASAARAQEIDTAGFTDEQTLRAAGLTTDGPALLDFFKKRSQTTPDTARIAALIKQLGDKSAETREKATGELVSVGVVAVPLLRQAAKDPDDPEVSGRARRCLAFIEGQQAVNIPLAAARLVSIRKPKDASTVLLDYLPYADEESVVEEVKNTLASLAVANGKPDPVIMKALEDKVSLKRAVAAEALSGVTTEEVRTALRKLLQDPRPMVQMRAALALATTGKDQKAVSTLVALLADVPVAQARLAEEYLINLAAEQSPKVSLGSDDISRQKCRDAWAAWWLESEKPTLLEEFTKRTLTDDLREKAIGFIKQMGDDDFDVREKAMNDLQALGSPIVSLLRQNVNHPDLEVRTRVQKSIQVLEKDKFVPLSAVTARLVALRKPAGAAAVLLAYLPFAEDDLVATEVRSALASVALPNGKPDPALVNGLKDKMPLRRAAAAEALWQGGAFDSQDAVKRLLKDEDAYVRMRVAVALAKSRDKEAMPVLIQALADLPPEDGSYAEDYLLYIAGEQAPRVSLGADEKTRVAARDAWMTWWKANSATVDLAPSPAVARQLGYTMLLFMDINGNPGKVMEVGRDGKARWEINGLQYPYDAQVLSNDRVLVAEYNGQKVSERNLKGDIIWQRVAYGTINVQRVANGNTFMVTRNQMIEVDKNGKDVNVINRPNGDVYAAQKTRDGQIVMITNAGQCLRLDSTGQKVLKQFPVGQITIGGLELLPNGRILVAQYNMNKVQEYDTEGKMIWEASVSSPTSAFRLPNGNTLVASSNTLQVLEIDRQGKTVSEQRYPTRVWKVRRR